jgi:hypothetical protein
VAGKARRQSQDRAHTLIGMPVTWNPCGKRTRLPSMRSKPAPNSTLDTVNAWPRWSVPFMYGYGHVPNHFGNRSRSSAGDRPAVSAGVGGSTSKRRSAAQRACACFSCAMSESRLAVCRGACVRERARRRRAQATHLRELNCLCRGLRGHGARPPRWRTVQSRCREAAEAQTRNAAKGKVRNLGRSMMDR